MRSRYRKPSIQFSNAPTLSKLVDQNRALESEIAELRRGQETLQDARIEYQMLMETSPDAIAIVDLNRTVVKANRKAAELMKCDRPEDLIGMSAIDFLSPREARQVRSRPLQVETSPNGAADEYTIFRKDGSEFVVEVRRSVIKDPRGDPTAILIIVRDITLRKKGEERLKQSREKYRSVFDGLDNPIAVYRSDGLLMMMNTAAAALRGGQPEDFIGQTLSGISSDQGALELRRIREVVESGDIKDYEAALDGPRGRRWYRTVYHPVRLETGEVFAVQVVSYDFTDRKKAEERVKREREKLRALASRVSLVEESERRRIAVELHDHVGQILATAKMKLGALKAQLADGEQGPVIGEVDSLCEQAIRFTRSLTLELSPPILYELGLEAAVEWLLDRQREQHDAEFVLVVDQHPKPLEDDIRVLLFLSIRELLLNVTRHARADKVALSIERAGEEIVVTIEDDGIGFDPANNNNRVVFGLYGIRERLDCVGGSLELKSVPGKGTRVVVRAPLKES